MQTKDCSNAKKESLVPTGLKYKKMGGKEEFLLLFLPKLGERALAPPAPPYSTGPVCTLLAPIFTVFFDIMAYMHIMQDQDSKLPRNLDL